MSKIKNKICFLHPCKDRNGLINCEYCSQYFCAEHLRAKPAGLPKFNETGSEALAFMKEWRAKDGHPCMHFNVHYYQERKNRELLQRQALSNILDGRNSPHYENTSQYSSDSSSDSEEIIVPPLKHGKMPAYENEYTPANNVNIHNRIRTATGDSHSAQFTYFLDWLAKSTHNGVLFVVFAAIALVFLIYLWIFR